MRQSGESIEPRRHDASSSNNTLSGPNQLIEAFYPELKRLAVARMRREPPEHSWRPTVLVNELYLELMKIKALRPVRRRDEQAKSAFFALSARVMRWLLARHARPLAWQADTTPVSESMPLHSPGSDALAQVDNLLGKLAEIDPQLRSVVELRVFEGLSVQETADRMHCSARTVNRQWCFAKAWLAKNLPPGSPGPPVAGGAAPGDPPVS